MKESGLALKCVLFTVVTLASYKDVYLSHVAAPSPQLSAASGTLAFWECPCRKHERFVRNPDCLSLQDGGIDDVDMATHKAQCLVDAKWADTEISFRDGNANSGWVFITLNDGVNAGGCRDAGARRALGILNSDGHGPHCGVRSKPSQAGGNLELRNLANYAQGTQWAL